jgi:hypothetical protein
MYFDGLTQDRKRGVGYFEIYAAINGPQFNKTSQRTEK